MTYDPVNDEIMVANANAQAIVTLRGGANGDEPPLRVIQGPKTQIQSPGYGNVVDAVNNEIFVVEGRDRPSEEYILVFPRTANGDVAPLRIIRGPNTMLKNARNIVVDPTRNLLAVGTDNGLLVFNRTDNGNVKPRAIIKGPDGNFRLTPKGWIVSSIGGRTGDTNEENAGARPAGGGEGRRRRPPSGIYVWHITDNGDVPPAYVLRNPKAPIGGGRVALNPNGKEVIIGGRLLVEAYSFPEIF